MSNEDDEIPEATSTAKRDSAMKVRCAVVPLSSSQSASKQRDSGEGSSGDQKMLCSVCSKVHPISLFIALKCSHKFCPDCASMMERTQLCPTCLNEFARGPSLGELTPPRSGVLFLGSRPDASAISVDTSFSIWGPVAPKSIDQDTHHSLPLPHSSLSSLVHSLPFGSPTQSEVGSHLEATASGSSARLPSTVGMFVAPPPVIDWRNTPSVDLTSYNYNLSNCTMCNEDNCFATVRCVQCCETLCSECVLAHYRVRITRDHDLVRLQPPFTAGITAPVGTVAKLEDMEGENCAVHDLQLVCICVTCSGSLLCNKCVAEHSKHQVVPHGELRTAVFTILANSKQDKKNLEDSLETIHRMTERVDASVQAVARELRSVIHLHISAIEERKRDLLQRMDTIRMSKMNILKAQSDRISQRLALLDEAIKASESLLKMGEPTEPQLRTCFESLLLVLREPSLYLAPNETDQIKFVPPDSSLISRMRSLGDLDSGACAHTTSIMGEGYRRAIKDRACIVCVQTRDACGDVCNSASQAILTATLTAPYGQPVQVHVKEREQGIYALTYYPVEEGPHVLDIQIRGVSISGCPATIQVRRGRDYKAVSNNGPLFSFGGEGTEDGKLCRPWGICCDNKGRIIVADRSNNRIQIFDKDGNFLRKFGSPGTRPGQFDRPAGVAVNTMNEIVVADKDNHRIQVFDETGSFLLKFGDRGRAPGTFNYPWGVAVNSYNQIAVSDTRNHRVQVFSPQGVFLRKCGYDSTLLYKNLDSPRGLCYLHDGQLLVTDFNNHRIAIMSARGSGDLKCYGSEGEAEGYFCRPQGVAVDNEGHVLVCDSRNNRIQVLSDDDLHCIATFGATQPTFGATAGNDKQQVATSTASGHSVAVGSVDKCAPVVSCTLDRPTDVCVSPDGLIYVVDFGSNLIRVY